MSSGSILLQQLRRRQSSNKSRSSNDKSSTDCKNDDAKFITSRDGSAASAPTNPSVAATSQRTVAMFATTKKKEQVIEVCLGPDCAVGGGGAALLEIEDLVRQMQRKCPNKQSNDDHVDTKLIIQAGGCRDHCTEGPNVRILSSYGGGVDCDFHKVNCPEACRRVMSSFCHRKDTTVNNDSQADQSTNVRATANDNKHDGSTTSSPSDDVVARLLLRKEDARRWKAHRERAAKERRLQAIARNEGS